MKRPTHSLEQISYSRLPSSLTAACSTHMLITVVKAVFMWDISQSNALFGREAQCLGSARSGSVSRRSFRYDGNRTSSHRARMTSPDDIRRDFVTRTEGASEDGARPHELLITASNGLRLIERCNLLERWQSRHQAHVRALAVTPFAALSTRGLIALHGTVWTTLVFISA